MGKYVVVKTFTDLKTNTIYHAGEQFPGKSKKATKERIRELSGDKNKRKQPLIVAVDPEKEQKADGQNQNPVNDLQGTE